MHCEMNGTCDAPVTHKDAKGYIYCARHAEDRKRGHYGVSCRKLTKAELETLRIKVQP